MKTKVIVYILCIIDIGDDPFYNLSITGRDVVFAEEPVVESRLIKLTEMKIMEQ